MGLRCVVGHDWDGCACKRCKATREHDWDGCACKRCAARRNEGHDWDGCTCKRCKATREHDWDGCACRRCKSTRHDWRKCACRRCEATQHDWNGCVCRKCQATREHDWNGCVCRKCKATREHELDGCTCKRCKATPHDLDGCVCRQCKATRHDWRESGLDVSCSRCGTVVQEQLHMYNAGVVAFNTGEYDAAVQWFKWAHRKYAIRSRFFTGGAVAFAQCRPNDWSCRHLERHIPSDVGRAALRTIAVFQLLNFGLHIDSRMNRFLFRNRWPGVIDVFAPVTGPGYFPVFSREKIHVPRRLLRRRRQHLHKGRGRLPSGAIANRRWNRHSPERGACLTVDRRRSRISVNPRKVGQSRAEADGAP